MANTPEEALQQLGATMKEAVTAGIQPLMDQNRDHRRAQGSAAQASSSSGKQYNKQQSGLLKSIVQKISLPLPGGARLFGLSSFMDKVGQTSALFQKGQESIKAWTAWEAEGREKAEKAWGKLSEERKKDRPDLDPAEIGAKKERAKNDAMTKGTMKFQTLTAGITAATTAVVLMTEGLRALGKSLGGVSEGQALAQVFGAVGESFQAAIKGEWLNPQAVLKVQGAIGQEFGQLISSDAAATMAKVATDYGVTTNQMAKLERTFQATAMGSREALASFHSVGILGQTAATELATNAGAVARAGDNFNEFIRDGIVNAKKLGLEFSKMESTLTGFTMDFEGTVSGFSELRAVIPGMATDFGQLLSTAMTGTTDEYIDQIRSSLLGAGISSASQMNRQQAALLEKATGFSADQIDRILKGEDLTADVQIDLDEKRNWLLAAQMGLLGGILGATISSWQALWRGTGAALTGAAVGAGALAIVGGTATALNDAYITKEGKTQRFSNDDNILLSKSGLGGGDGGVVAALGRIESALSRRQMIDLRGGQAFVERHNENAYRGQMRTA